MGGSAALAQALTDSGTYRGEVLGQTDRYVIQQQSSQMAVLHDKNRLPQTLEVGKAYTINYTDGAAAVRESKQRASFKELGR